MDGIRSLVSVNFIVLMLKPNYSPFFVGKPVFKTWFLNLLIDNSIEKKIAFKFNFNEFVSYEIISTWEK